MEEIAYLEYDLLLDLLFLWLLDLACGSGAERSGGLITCSKTSGLSGSISLSFSVSKKLAKATYTTHQNRNRYTMACNP